MCGIGGWMGYGQDAAKARQLIGHMSHRGPDGSGIFQSPQCTLIHTRLSIIDLNGGHQPMATPDDRYHISFNGEIYNHQRLRAQYEKLGFTFRTQSDTEVLLAGFALKGPDFINEVVGMFAFAVFDAVEETLFLFRDRLGIKPLFLFQDHGVVFASELGTLLGFLDQKPALSRQAFLTYMQLGYYPDTLTPFEKVQSVAPGTYVKIKGAQSETVVYYQLKKGSPSDPKELPALSSEVIKDHLVSDVEVGLFLSGGLDSSVIAGETKDAGQILRSFSVGFPGMGRFDETFFIKKACRTLGLPEMHYEFKPSDVEAFEEVLGALDLPLYDHSALALFVLCRETAREVKVALAGDGGDELFGGYYRYPWAKTCSRYRSLPGMLKWPLQLARLFPQGSVQGVGNVLRRCRKFVETADLPFMELYSQWMSVFAEQELKRFLKPEVFADTKGVGQNHFSDLVARCGSEDAVDQARYIDIHSFLSNNLLVKSDRISMHHGLEVRVPFVDHRLVEYAYNLPSTHLFEGKEGKKPLKKLAAKWFERDFIYRKKQGFEVPLDDWFRGPLQGLVRDTLNEQSLAELGVLNPSEVFSLLEDHMQGKVAASRPLYALMVFLHLWRGWGKPSFI